MREGRSAFLLVFAETGKPAIAVNDLAAQKALLDTRFGNDGWETPGILKRLDTVPDLYFDRVSQIRMPGWTKGRTVLVGDATHSPSLLAGAGAAFAMLGADILVEELHVADGDFARAFPAYERRFRAFMVRQQDAAIRFAGSFTPRSQTGILLRDCVVNLMNVPQIGVRLRPAVPPCRANQLSVRSQLLPHPLAGAH